MIRVVPTGHKIINLHARAEPNCFRPGRILLHELAFHLDLRDLAIRRTDASMPSRRLINGESGRNLLSWINWDKWTGNDMALFCVVVAAAAAAAAAPI